MTALKRFVQRLAEKIAGRYWEGPDPPERLGQLVIVFANANPKATRKEWVDFARNHAEESYRSGFMRGYENAERDPNPPDVEPEMIADLLDPMWREKAYDWRLPDGGFTVNDESQPVPEVVTEVETLEDMVKRFSNEGRERL